LASSVAPEILLAVRDFSECLLRRAGSRRCEVAREPPTRGAAACETGRMPRKVQLEPTPSAPSKSTERRAQDTIRRSQPRAQQLQRNAGNRATSHLLRIGQAKLEV